MDIVKLDTTALVNVKQLVRKDVVRGLGREHKLPWAMLK